MKDLKEMTVPLPEETVPVQAETDSQPEEQERQFWLDAKYSDVSQDSDR